MCGRITQEGGELPRHVTVTLVEELFPPRFNGAPSQTFWAIRRHPKSGEYHRDRLAASVLSRWPPKVPLALPCEADELTSAMTEAESASQNQRF